MLSISEIQISQGGVCCESRGKRRSTSVNTVTSQFQVFQDGGVFIEGRGKRIRSTSVANNVVTQIQISQGGVCWEGRGKRRSTRSISHRGNKTTTSIDCEQSFFCSKTCEQLRYDVGVCKRRSRENWRPHNSLLTASPLA